MMRIDGRDIPLGHDGLPANPKDWEAYVKFWKQHHEEQRGARPESGTLGDKAQAPQKTRRSK